ncbi:MAG TPA: energy transducer TonB [Gemmatimonadaceae bacterium]|nr:energy transducer TonB [Gemmatimonadaceae bacterium]
MRGSVVGFIGVGAVAVAFAVPVRSSASVRDGRPKCGGHGWALNQLDTSHIYDVDVDQQAVPERGNPQIPWPGTIGQNYNGTAEADMKLSGDASVVGKFVVDTMGCVDSSTFKVVSTSDSAFTQSVERMLPKLRYEPAKKDGKKVRSWVLWKFAFYRRHGSEAPIGP